jgi:hypothetical protein
MSFFDCNGTIHDDQASLGQSWFISKSLFHTKGQKDRQTDRRSLFFWDELCENPSYLLPHKAVIVFYVKIAFNYN